MLNYHWYKLNNEAKAMQYITSFILLLITSLAHAHPGHGVAPSYTLWHYLIDHYHLVIVLAVAVICFSLHKKY